MAYFSLHAYDADVWVPSFLGLRQQDESLNSDPRFATDVLNAETPNGVLQPHAAYDILPGDFGENRAETIARFYRRYYDGTGSKHWLIAAAGGKLYYMQEGSNVEWHEIQRGSGATPFQSNVWSWVTYEDNSDTSLDHPVDILLMSNPVDGMIEVLPPDKPTVWADLEDKTWADLEEQTWDEIYSPSWAIRTVTLPEGIKFGIIERYAERIWGCDIPGQPDKLMYSAPFDPTDWEANTEIPEDGAGEIDQPSWDGDSFTALRAFGDQLIAFKQHRVWRIYGKSPDEFTMSQQYGGGAPYFNTISVDVERVYFADTNGLSVYDGMSVQPFQRKLIEPLWRKINRDAIGQMCGALYNNRYYLAIPTGDSPVNNAVIVLNLEEGTLLYYDDMKIESLIASYNNIYATSSSLPGRVMELQYNSWITGRANGGAVKWVSPWMDFGYKRIQKGGFDLYLTPEVQDEPVTLRISIQTEKKTKTKEYTVVPLTAEQREANKEHRNKKLHFGGAGRRFRIIIETDEGVTAPWRLLGGLHLVVETDPD